MQQFIQASAPTESRADLLLLRLLPRRKTRRSLVSDFSADHRTFTGQTEYDLSEPDEKDADYLRDLDIDIEEEMRTQ